VHLVFMIMFVINNTGQLVDIFHGILFDDRKLRIQVL
jgi:hypothetical protein